MSYPDREDREYIERLEEVTDSLENEISELQADIDRLEGEIVKYKEEIKRLTEIEVWYERMRNV